MTEPVKESATILDATAGNRTLWKTKEDSRILWIDIEPELSFKPDLLLDCTDTKFEDKRFNLIIFDPPHEWGREKNETLFTTPNEEIAKKNWSERGHPRYYGADKYKTGEDLISFIFKAEKEFSRILNDNGVLFIKWSNIRIVFDKFSEIFSKWNLMIKIPTKKTDLSGNQTYWFMFMKKVGNPIISESINTIISKKETSLEMF